MNQSSNFHHALPAVLSDNHTTPSKKAKKAETTSAAELDKWVAQLKETYFDDINSLPAKGTHASSQPIENTE